MHLFQWIIIFFLYALICTLISQVTGISPEKVFWGIPGVIVLIGLVGAVIGGVAAIGGASSSGSSIKNNQPSESTKKLLVQISNLESFNKKLKSNQADLTQDLIEYFKACNFSGYFNLDSLEQLYIALSLNQVSDNDLIPNQEYLFKIHSSEEEAKLYTKLREMALQKINEDLHKKINKDTLLEEILKVLDSVSPAFPTPLSLVNIQAVPAGSFLEKIIPHEFSISERPFASWSNIKSFRELSESFKDRAGHARFENFLNSALLRTRSKNEKKISSTMSKDKLKASDIKNVITWSVIFCYSELESDFTYVKRNIDELIAKASAQKPSSAIRKAIDLAKEFLALPKGAGEKSAAEKLDNLKARLQALKNSASNSSFLVGVDFVEALLSIVAEFKYFNPTEIGEEGMRCLIEILRVARINISDAGYAESDLSLKSEQLSLAIKECIQMSQKMEERK